MKIPWFACPKCNSSDIQALSPEIDSDVVWIVVECEKCGFEWQEIYTFSHNESTDENCNILDNKGDPVENIILEPLDK